LACDESGASEVHKQSLRTNKNGHTELSRAYSGRLARFSPNAFTKRHQDAKSQTLPYPAQSWLTSPIKNAAIETNQKDYVPLYAGQGVPLIHHTSAKDLMNELSQEF